MVKKVNFGAKRPTEATADETIDKWVEDREPGALEPTKRFTIDVPVSLHKRIKSQCALEDLVMADVLRELLEKRFPESGQGGQS